MLAIFKAEFADITAKSTADLMRVTNPCLPLNDRISHEIQIEPGAKPIKQKTRGIPYNYREDFKKTIMEMKAAGMVVDSKSPWSSPIRLVKKKDGSVRICVDFRKVNAVTIKDAYPIPRIEDLFTYLGSARIFSSLDLAKGYYQVAMDPASTPYTAFSCEFGFFEYTVLPMGLTNACATFQRLMNTVLSDLIGKICVVYLDDIIIFSDSIEQHTDHVVQVANRLRLFNLKVNLKKCTFATTQVEYLSHIIGEGKIMPNPGKITAVAAFERPTSVKSVRSFLGLVSYYRKFIKNCANHASPLIALTTKGNSFIWTQECQQSFEYLRSILISDHVLILPEYDSPFRVEADASKYGVGGVLSQFRDGSWRPVSYFSKHLSKTEVNYSASEREMLAIVLSVERFKQYLYGREFVILSDHQPLKFLLTADVPNARLARLMNRLLIYSYTIEYRAGSAHGNADALSRMVDERLCGVLDYETETSVMINAIRLKSHSNDEQLLDRNIKRIIDLKLQFRKLYVRPEIDWATVAHEDLKELQSLFRQWDRLYVIGKNLYREYIADNDDVSYQYVVPRSQRLPVLKQAHDSSTSGHLGVEKTIERIIPKLYWYKQLDDIKAYVQSCTSCQSVKSAQRYNIAPMQPIRTTRPSELLTTDIMGPLPTTDGGNRYVLVVVDHFTKWVELFAMETQTAEDVAKRLMLVFYRHGIPETILSDQGTNFQSILLSEIYELLDVHKVRTSPYHPQTDGLTERFNRTLQAMLACYVDENQKDWDTFLPTLAFAYNTAVHSTTLMTPFELTYGRRPKVPLDLLFKEPKLELYLDHEGYAREIQKVFYRAFDMVISSRDRSMDKNKLRFDRKVRAANFEVTDLVWILDTTKKVGKSSKLARKWKGPYEILGKINGYTYEVKPKFVRGKKLVVNQCRMAKCFTRDYLNVAKRNLTEQKVSTTTGSPASKPAVEIAESPIIPVEPPVEPQETLFEVGDEVALGPVPERPLRVTFEGESDQSFRPNYYYQRKLTEAASTETRKSSRLRKKPDRLGAE